MVDFADISDDKLLASQLFESWFFDFQDGGHPVHHFGFLRSLNFNGR